MSRERIHIISKLNLDGAGCITVLKNLYSSALITHEGAIDKNLRSCLERNKVGYDKLFVCGFHLNEDDIRIISSNKSVFIFNNIDSVESLTQTNCTIFYKTCDSVTELIFKERKLLVDIDFTKEQKVLIKLISDFESYNLKTPLSYALNIVYYSFSGDRLKQFSNVFKDGFTGFNAQHQAVLQYHQRRITDIISNLEPYITKLKLKDKEYTAMCAFSDYGVNEICQHFFEKTGADIGIVVNLDKNYVSFRASKECDYDVSLLAVKLCDGGGRSKTAGGSLTEKFLTFSKLFSKYES